MAIALQIEVQKMFRVTLGTWTNANYKCRFQVRNAWQHEPCLFLIVLALVPKTLP